MSKRSVAVEIAGQQYHILSDADEQSLHRLAAYVDRAMGRVREGTGTADSLDVAVLTCLNMAREILSMREQRGSGVGDQKLRTLIERVERALGDMAGTESAVANEEAAAAEPEASAAEPAAEEGARTLDLPSVEALRDRASSSEETPESQSAELPEARLAAGGRERAS